MCGPPATVVCQDFEATGTATGAKRCAGRRYWRRQVARSHTANPLVARIGDIQSVPAEVGNAHGSIEHSSGRRAAVAREAPHSGACHDGLILDKVAALIQP